MTPQKQTPVKVQEKHVFTTEEREEYLDQLLQAMSQKSDIEADFKATKSNYKSKIDQKDAEIKLVQNLLTSGFENRSVSCVLVKNFDSGKREYYEVDTNRLVSTENLTAQDHQTEMELQEAEIKANNEQAEINEANTVEGNPNEATISPAEPTSPAEDTNTPKEEINAVKEVLTQQIARETLDNASEVEHVGKGLEDFDFGDEIIPDENITDDDDIFNFDED